MGSAGACVFQWHQSTFSNPYAGGKALISMSGTAGSWVVQTGQDFYFRTYFQSPVAPTLTELQVDFTAGNSQGTIIDDSGALTTDFKLAMALVVDDSRSITWADPSKTRLTSISSLLTTLFGRTVTNLSSGTQNFCPSFADFWEFGTEEIERTTGFSDNLNALQLDGAALFGRGLNSAFYDCANIAISGLNARSIVDAVIKVGDAPGNAMRVSNIVRYLEDRSAFRLGDVVTYWNSLPVPKSPWDGTAANICNYDDVSQFVANRWAQTFTPSVILIADGDDATSGTFTEVSQTAQSAWGGVGVPVQSFGLGRSHAEGGARSISVNTGGRHFDVSQEPVDWGVSINSLLHGGANNLYIASWAVNYDFESPTWIQALTANFTVPAVSGVGSVPATCSVTAQWTTDRVHWTDFQSLESGIDLVVTDLLFGLRFKVQMSDGWTGAAPARPKPSSLKYVIVTPSFQYLVTKPQISSGTLFEYLLSAAADLPVTAVLSWGVVRGNSTDFADFEPIRNGRKGALSNRQQGLRFELRKALVQPRSQNNQVGATVYVLWSPP